MPTYSYKVIPANSINLQKMPTAMSVLPLVNSECRTQLLILKNIDNVKFGVCNFGLGNFWMLNLLESEIATFNLVAFEGVETYTNEQIIELFSTLFNFGA